MAALTPAELRVLDAMRDAETEEDAARELGLSKHTVHNHLANARAKLRVRSTRLAVLRAHTPSTFVR